jgi:plasmid stability protein
MLRGLMANLTIAIEDTLLREARVRAVEEGTSVNAVVRAFLRDYTGGVGEQAAAGRRLVQLARENRTALGPITWSRDDLYER